MNLQPETLSNNFYEYTKILKPNEIQLVNRKLGKNIIKEAPLSNSNSLSDLKSFFLKSLNKTNESQLNYFIIKKWVGKIFNKNKDQPIIIYLSVDFFYSIYQEKVNKEGEKELELKYTFQAEKCTINSKPNNNFIEIVFSSIGILWNSKKKIKIELTSDYIDEFLLHYQQAKIIMGSNSGVNLYQSSIITKSEYEDVTDKTEVVDSQVVSESVSNKEIKKMNDSGSKNIKTDDNNQIEEDDDYNNNNKLYASEIVQNTDQFSNKEEMSYFDQEKLKNMNFSKNRNIDQTKTFEKKYSSNDDEDSEEYISEPKIAYYENNSERKSNSKYSNSLDDNDGEYSNSSFKD